MRIKNVSLISQNIHKVVAPVAGSTLLTDMRIDPGEEKLIYEEVAEQHVELADLITRGVIERISSEEPGPGPTHPSSTLILLDKVASAPSGAMIPGQPAIWYQEDPSDPGSGQLMFWNGVRPSIIGG